MNATTATTTAPDGTAPADSPALRATPVTCAPSRASTIPEAP